MIDRRQLVPGGPAAGTPPVPVGPLAHLDPAIAGGAGTWGAAATLQQVISEERFATIAFMSTESIITLLIAEREKLDRAIKALGGSTGSTSNVETVMPKKKRQISAATRRKMALGQQKRYAALQAAK
jgi:hypothetical protein